MPGVKAIGLGAVSDNLLKGFRRVGPRISPAMVCPEKSRGTKIADARVLPKARQITRIGVKCDLARRRFRERCGARHFQRRITAQFSSGKGPRVP